MPRLETCELGQLRFHKSGGGCFNTAFSTIIAHEYGHFVVASLPQGSPQGIDLRPFREGFSDSLAVLLFDDSVIGRDLCGSGTKLRDVACVNVQYPCPATPQNCSNQCGGNSTYHSCGQLLAGVWWDINERFKESLNHGHTTLRRVVAPRTLLEEFAKIKSGDVVLPAQMADGSRRTIHLRCVTTPDEAQKVLLNRLGLTLPRRLRRIDEVAQM